MFQTERVLIDFDICRQWERYAQTCCMRHIKIIYSEQQGTWPTLLENSRDGSQLDFPLKRSRQKANPLIDALMWYAMVFYFIFTLSVRVFITMGLPALLIVRVMQPICKLRGERGVNKVRFMFPCVSTVYAKSSLSLSFTDIECQSRMQTIWWVKQYKQWRSFVPILALALSLLGLTEKKIQVMILYQSKFSITR